MSEWWIDGDDDVNDDAGKRSPQAFSCFLHELCASVVLVYAGWIFYILD